MPTSSRRYGSNPRWLLKALREVAHEVQQLTWGIDDALLTRRPPPETGLREDWSILEIVGFLRDSEAEDLRAVQAICARSGARLPERRAHLGPVSAATASISSRTCCGGSPRYARSCSGRCNGPRRPGSTTASIATAAR